MPGGAAHIGNNCGCLIHDSHILRRSMPGHKHGAFRKIIQTFLILKNECLAETDALAGNNSFIEDDVIPPDPGGNTSLRS